MRKLLQNKILILVMAVLVILVVFAVFKSLTPQKPVKQVAAPTPTIDPKLTDNPNKVKLEGEVICLPPWDPSGAQSTECAYGLQTANGEKYVLDPRELNSPPYGIGDSILVSGDFTPKEMLSAAHWQKYDIKGILSITGAIEKK